ncbi:MAG TPA: hypothetical protein VEU07_05455, partial [Candidatus Acidoferrum sp.]|nr:hypothetical protein [Candidatus Acidoferrum sp.]
LDWWKVEEVYMEEARQTPVQESTRLSRLALVAFLSGAAVWPSTLLGFSLFGEELVDALGGDLLLTLALWIVFLGFVAAVVLAIAAVRAIKRNPSILRGRRLARAGMVAGALSFVWAMLWVPSLIIPSHSKMERATAATREAVIGAIRHGNRTGNYPISLNALRDSGGRKVRDQDSWGRDYVLSPVLTLGATPQATDDVYIYSKGPCGTGRYEPSRWHKDSQRRLDTGKCGAIGYSSIYGQFQGE